MLSKAVKTSVVAFLLLLAVDAVWLFFVGPTALSMTAAIQGSPVVFRILPAFIVYVALTYLVQLPTSPTQAFLMGASVYAVYDFTNLTLLTKYSPLIAVADTMWGGVLFLTVHMILQRITSQI
jgi:uncharacterized membrane protein